MLIITLKHKFIKQFPDNELTNILSKEPDEMSIEALISKVGTWLAILDATHNNLNDGMTMEERL